MDLRCGQNCFYSIVETLCTTNKHILGLSYEDDRLPVFLYCYINIFALEPQVWTLLRSRYSLRQSTGIRIGMEKTGSVNLETLSL
jgi:hypothetical protein